MQDGRIKEQFDVDGFSAHMDIKNDKILVTDLPKAFSHFTNMIAHLLASRNNFAMDAEQITESKKTAKEVFDILKDPLAEAVQQYPTKEYMEPYIEWLENLLKFMFTKASNPDFTILSKAEVQSFATQVWITLKEETHTSDDDKASFYKQLKKIQR